MKILFRADSSSEIGLGHIMRDLVLVKQFKDANIMFACRDLEGNINHKIIEDGYRLKILKSNDINELDSLIKNLKIDIIVIDHYEIDYKVEKQLKIQNSKLEIFSLDDTYEKHHCDILLNHNISADASKYDGLVPNWCELRCGSKYTLLRDEFKVMRKKKKDIAQNGKLTVFIAMGGSDHSHKNIDILKVLEKFQNINVHVITTTANQYLSEVKKYVEDKDNITLYINTNQIAKLMHKATFAIVTPSVTINEVIYMKLPFIAIKTAENQNEIYEYLSNNNYFVLEKFNSIKLKNNIEELIDLLSVELINFIDLSLSDKKIILEWRNNPKICKWMFTQKKIGLRDHLAYIESLKTRKDRLYFLVKKNTKDIGVIDFTSIDMKTKTTNFGIYANPGLKGVGNLLMKSLIDYAFKILKVKTIISEVINSNIVAIKLYHKYNFKDIGTKKVNQKNVICMELKNENR